MASLGSRFLCLVALLACRSEPSYATVREHWYFVSQERSDDVLRQLRAEHIDAGTRRLLELRRGDDSLPRIIDSCIGCTPPVLATLADTLVEAHQYQVEHGSAFAQHGFVARNLYTPKPGAFSDALLVRARASDVRAARGVSPGIILRGSDAFVWEQGFSTLRPELLQEDKAATSSPEFRAVQSEMRALLTRFRQGLWELR